MKRVKGCVAVMAGASTCSKLPVRSLYNPTESIVSMPKINAYVGIMNIFADSFIPRRFAMVTIAIAIKHSAIL
jgi:hypothetical protein